jgi:hypothetical protein
MGIDGDKMRGLPLGKVLAIKDSVTSSLARHLFLFKFPALLVSTSSCG